MSKINIFIFRRDFRLYDNTSLYELIKTYPNMKILLIFIFNQRQIDKSVNKYYSSNAVQFLFECFNDIPHLNFYYTKTDDIQILNELSTRFNINAIAFNKDYTPYAIIRDENIRNWCNIHQINHISFEDYTLYHLNSVLKDDKKPYLKFTPFYKKALTIHPPDIQSKLINHKLFIKDIKSLSNINQFKTEEINPYIKVHGGRNNALKILQQLKNKEFNDYDKNRDYPFYDKTTKLSAYIKFGCISIREIYNCLPKTHGIVRELIWHDFYSYIIYYFPHVIGNSYIRKYDKVKWDNNLLLFEKWKLGQTGFPLVDAAMNQLNKTGWLHNRCRMIVASFLTKNLLIDWRWGEKYFASKLVDYDPASNNGGWQWCASTGTDAQPYFRIFSPTSQLKRFDKDCKYVKEWIPKLKDVDNKIILNWDKKQISNIDYPHPIVDFSKTSKHFISVFKEII
jgi:deoxyribodipyrimidine photo-lyase